MATLEEPMQVIIEDKHDNQIKPLPEEGPFNNLPDDIIQVLSSYLSPKTQYCYKLCSKRTLHVVKDTVFDQLFAIPFYQKENRTLLKAKIHCEIATTNQIAYLKKAIRYEPSFTEHHTICKDPWIKTRVRVHHLIGIFKTNNIPDIVQFLTLFGKNIQENVSECASTYVFPDLNQIGIHCCSNVTLFRIWREFSFTIYCKNERYDHTDPPHPIVEAMWRKVAIHGDMEVINEIFDWIHIPDHVLRYVNEITMHLALQHQNHKVVEYLKSIGCPTHPRWTRLLKH